MTRLKEKMRAYLWTGFGGPEMLEYREDVPVPEPGPDEVLIEVGACACNNTDIWNREGGYGRGDDPTTVSGWLRGAAPQRFPRIQGADIAGTIVEVGANVVPSRVGEHVLVNMTLYDFGCRGLHDAGLIGSERDGGFAEYVVVPAENALEVTADYGPVEIAAMGPCSALTAEHMLNRSRLAAGETVFITGASGGVGTAAIQLSRIRGAFTIALVGPGKEEQAFALGADKVITRGAEDLHGAVADACGGRDVDVVTDVVGGPMLGDFLEILRPGGRIVTVGAIAGHVVELDIRTIYLKHLDFLGSTMGTKEEFADLERYINTGRFRPVIGGTYDLADLPRAQADFKTKNFFGNLVIVPKRDTRFTPTALSRQ